jgi:hypothetical protein
MRALQSEQADRERPKPIPHVISGRRMRVAQLRGEVKPFSPQFLNLVQYLGHWWVQDATEWIRLSGAGLEAVMKAVKADSTALYRSLYSKQPGTPEPP